MDEISAIQKAREFINAVRPQTIPVPVNEFVDHIGAIVRMENDLEPDEPGWSFKNKGKHYICVNSKDKYERQRFTICHELAHILLARILHEQCEVEPFSVWSDKPRLQGLHGVHDRLFRYDWADFGRTSPNPRCLSTCRGSTRRGSGGVQANGHHTEQLLMRTGTA